MKRLMTVAALTLIASAAIAGNSDRYDDMRLDTSKKATEANADAATREPLAVTRSSRTPIVPPTSEKPSYAYASPFGVGPDNDSR